MHSKSVACLAMTRTLERKRNHLKDKKQVFQIQKPYHIITIELFNQFVIIMVPKLAKLFFKKLLKDIKIIKNSFRHLREAEIVGDECWQQKLLVTI